MEKGRRLGVLNAISEENDRYKSGMESYYVFTTRLIIELEFVFVSIFVNFTALIASISEI